MKLVFPVKSVLLCFLLIVCLAGPVQSQTPVPTLPARLTNPTAAQLGSCGLPATYAQFNDSATLTTFNMTADCTIHSWSYQAPLAFLYFTSGEFTINGNGHSIIGPTGFGYAIYVQNAGTVLNLNNVTLRGSNSTQALTVHGARLNARNIIFRDNGDTLFVRDSGQAYFENAQFLNNSVASNNIVRTSNQSRLSITNGIFRGNTNTGGPIVRVDVHSTSFIGSNIIFENNSASTVLWVSGVSLNTNPNRARATLQNAQFLNNRQNLYNDPGSPNWNSASQSMGSAVTAYYGDVTVTNGIFRGNRNHAARTNVILGLFTWSAVGTRSESTINLEGCMTFENNVQSDGSTAASDYNLYPFGTGYGINRGGSRITDNRTGVCPPGGFPTPKKKKEEAPAAMPTSTPRPAYGASYVALQTETGMTFEATYGLDSGVHFRQLDGAGIGIQSIIDAGYLAALDVYGYVEQGVEVCFPQMGRVIFLDARTMPRAIVPLESTVVNGMTCVSINSPGSLVLLPN